MLGDNWLLPEKAVDDKVRFMIHLRALERRSAHLEKGQTRYPFNLPLITSLESLIFGAPVTFLVGENGSGKSTVLEMIACAVESITVGSESVKTDKTLADVRKLAHVYRPIWNKRTRRGFFLRAEDFFGFAKRIDEIKADMAAELERVDREYEHRSKLAVGLAKLPFSRELHDLEQLYGEGLDHASHGESFLALFESRFVPDGLYLLDEPEAPLSPLRQLTFLSMLKRMVHEQNGQFIIATHSPIILAFPDAEIYNFADGTMALTPYDELEHVTLTRSFLENPNAYLRHL